MIVSISIGIHNIDTVTASNQYPARIRFAKAQNSTHRRVSWTFRRNFFFYTLLLSANASASIFNSFFSVLLIFQTLSLVSVDAAGSWCACQTNETVNQLFFSFFSGYAYVWALQRSIASDRRRVRVSPGERPLIFAILFSVFTYFLLPCHRVMWNAIFYFLSFS